ncbi:MAG: Ig-like domain-containing protein [Ruminococcus sp.]|nr:Ig-like domain-containing protein [Ruminococcus sp.]
MKKVSKRLLSVLMVLLMLVPSVSMIAQAAGASKIAENTVTFDLDDLVKDEEGQVDVSADKNGNLAMNFSGMSTESPIVYSEEDSKYDAGSNLSYVATVKDTNLGLYKVEEKNEAQIIEDVTETESEAEDYLDACLSQKPMTKYETTGFLNISSMRANPNPNMDYVDPVGVEKNSTSKMRLVNESNSADGSIVVLDDDAIAIMVKDTSDNVVKGAYVTIRYTDIDGKVQTRTVKTDDQFGAAIFDKMNGVYFAAVDIQHEDYQAKTALNVAIEPGEAIEKVLEPKKENDLYIRCADLDGLDMTEYSGEINISDADMFKQDITYTVMVSKNGNKTLPEKIRLCAENAGEKRVVKIFEKSSDVYSNENTASYVCKDKWVSHELFRNGDVIFYDIEPTTLKASNGPGASIKSGVTVTDAKSKIPMWTTTKYGFLAGIASYKFNDSVPVIGGDTVGLDLFKCPVSFAILPDGSVFMSYGVNYINEGKPEEMVSASWNPNKAELAKSFFKKANNEFLSKISQFKEGKNLFAKNSESKTRVDSAYKFSVDVIFSAIGHYDKETKKVSVKLGAVISVNGSYGKTWYVLIPVGFGSIPAYSGFKAGVNGRAAGYMTLSMGIKDNVGDMLSSIKFEAKKDGEAGISLDVILSLAAYVGVGLHDLACIQADGSVYMDFGVDVVTSDMVQHQKADPRFRITGGYKVGISATFLWFKYSKKFDSNSYWLYDSWGEYGKANPAKLMADNSTVQKIDLDASQSQLTKVVSNSNDSGLEQYKIKPLLKAAGNSNEKLIDSKTLNACAPRYIQTENYAALFRMIPVDGRVRLAYQLMRYDGVLDSTVNVLPLPDRDESQRCNDVTEYDVIAGEGNKIAVAMIGCDANEENIELKERSTYAVAETLDLDNGGALSYCVTNTNREFYDYLSNPIAIYRPDKNTCGFIGRETFSDDPISNYYYNDYWYPNYTDAIQHVIYDQNYRSTKNAPVSLSCKKVSGNKFYYASKLDSTDSIPNSNRGSLIFDYKTLTGKDWDGESSAISYSRTVGNKTYVVIDGKLYYLTFTANGYGDRTYSLVPVKGFNDEEIILGDENVYDIQKDVKGNVSLTSLVSDYDEEGNCTGSTLQVYRITDPDTDPVIHGPQEIKLDVKEPSSFTALADSPTGACIAFYTTPIAEEKTGDGVTDSAQLYQWNQSASAQAKIESVTFTKNYISGTDTAIPMKVICKNTGTKRLSTVTVETYLECTSKYIEKSFNVDLYPGDTATLDLTDTPRPASWKTGVHSIGVRTDIEGDFMSTKALKSSDLQDDMYKVSFDNSYLKMDIKTKFVNGSNKAFVTISNESMVSSQTPVLQLVGKFKSTGSDDSNSERVIKNIELPIRKLTDADVYENGEAQGIKYNTSFDLDEIWNQYDNGKDILYSITAKLVPKSVANGYVTGEEAEKLCNNMPESVYIPNPNISRVININANPDTLIMGKVDGNGTYNIGDTVKLIAMPSYGYKFLGWFNGDELVSEDAELTFDAKENVNLTAKFAPDVAAVTVNDMKLNYKQSAKLTTVIDVEDGTQYVVTYTTSNPNIVSVDVDGNVTALKRGNAIVTCTVTDIFGNQKQDTCLVTVKYSWWQWLIKIVLFGWIWY